jgi:hypothetical protein
MKKNKASEFLTFINIFFKTSLLDRGLFIVCFYSGVSFFLLEKYGVLMLTYLIRGCFQQQNSESNYDISQKLALGI